MWGRHLACQHCYRGAVIIVLTVAVSLAPQGVENFVRRQISILPLTSSK